MSRKIVVVGGVAGGASAAARARRLDAQAEIVVLERGEHVSFSNCCIPYHISGMIENSDSLVLMTPKDFKEKHDIDVFTGREVIAINRAEKTVYIRNGETGGIYTESYDKLILSPGASPLRPGNIGGVDKPHVFTVRNVADIRALKAFIQRGDVKEVVVAGGGFIGLEVVENLKEAGKDVTLIEGLNQIMTPFDYDMAQILHKELMDHGVKLMLDAMVTSIEDGKVNVRQGDREVCVAAQAVVLSIGVRPETKLAEDAGLKIGVTGGIEVNHNYQTSDPDIYAVGDAIEVYNSLTQRPGRLALAGPAQRQARSAADHINGIPCVNKGVIGSSCLRLFEQRAACTGLNEKTARQAGIPYDFAFVIPPDKPGIMPDSRYMCFKLLFEVPTGRILGAQAVGKGVVDKRIDVIAAMITMNGTLDDLKELELCYSPVFGTAKDIVNIAALVGLNILNNRYRQVHVGDVRLLVEEGAYIIDVREEREYAAGHIKGAHNVPLSQLRQRVAEIPKDIPVYLHCRTSQRSYYALMYLQGNGYKNVYNISGSYLGISLYEYFNDKTLCRDSILTEYNFA